MAHSRLDATGTPGTARSGHLARQIQEIGGFKRDTEAYAGLVRLWKEITDGETWIGTGLCCQHSNRGAPECCARLIDGSDRLTFTYHERAIVSELYGLGRDDFEIDPRTGMLWYMGDQTDDEHRELLHTGWMSKTIECASHPLRPIVGDSRKVIGTVAIDGCNTELMYEQYGERRDEIASLWQLTVDLFGVKPYYVTYNLKRDWTVL